MTTELNAARNEKARQYYRENADRVKARNAEYRKRPEVRERINQRRREQACLPHIIERKRAYLAREDVVARRKERDAIRAGDPHFLEMRRISSDKRYETNWSKQKIKDLRIKAKQRGLDFNIEESDIPLPKVCPILLIPLERGRGASRMGSPSVDRIDNTRGYVKGNVVVVSMKANAMKKDATLDDLRRMVKFYEQLEKSK